MDKWASKYLQTLKNLDVPEPEPQQRDGMHHLRMVLAKLGYLQPTSTLPPLPPMPPLPPLPPLPPQLNGTIKDVPSFSPEDVLGDWDEERDQMPQKDESPFQTDQSPAQTLGTLTDNWQTDSPPHGQPATARYKQTQERDQDPTTASVSRDSAPYGDEVAKEQESLGGTVSVNEYGNTVPSSAAAEGAKSDLEEVLREEIKKRDSYIRYLDNVCATQEQNIQQMTDKLMEVTMVDRHIIDDNELEGLWKGLVYNVSSFVSSRLVAGHRSPKYPEIAKQLCLTPWNWIRGADRGQLVFEALIWNQLLFYVFNRGCHLWAPHDLSQSMGLLRFRLESKFALFP